MCLTNISLQFGAKSDLKIVQVTDQFGIGTELCSCGTGGVLQNWTHARL